MLPEGTLRDKINEYSKKSFFPIENIYVMDQSKRSKRMNAYFLGYGKKRRLVLFDTLIEKMSDEEIVAILAHETGHAKHKDYLRRMPISLLNIGIILFMLFFFLSSNDLSDAFGFSSSTFVFGFLVFFEVISLIGMFTSIITNYISRKHEYAADKYAAQTYSKVHMISALKVLAREELVNLAPNKIVVLMTYSHPPIAQRINAIEDLKQV